MDMPWVIVVAGIAGALGYFTSLCMHRASKTSAAREYREVKAVEPAGERTFDQFREMELRHEKLEAELKRQNTELVLMLAERDSLVKEIHHRVKNNLQVIASLLRLQSGYLEGSAAKSMFRNSEDRVMSMALVHDQLYRAKKLSQIDFVAYVEELVPILRKRYANDAPQLEVSLELEPVCFTIEQAMPAALILNELLSNAFKHGRKPNCDGRVIVGLSMQDGVCLLSVQDSGVGFSVAQDGEMPRTLGMRVVETLCRQLSASLDINANNGTSVSVRFARQLPVAPAACAA